MAEEFEPGSQARTRAEAQIALMRRLRDCINLCAREWDITHVDVVGSLQTLSTEMQLELLGVVEDEEEDDYGELD